MKLNISIFIVMLAFSANVKAQYKPFKADKIKDSLWIKQLLEERHQKNLIQGQTTLTDAAIYRQGKVFYSPDKYLRMAQLKGIYDFNGTREVTFYLTVLQFRSGKNIIEKTFHGENNVLENPIINIYRLPGNSFSYLLIGEENNKRYAPWSPKNGDGSNFNAAVFRFEKDSIHKLNFYNDPSDINLELRYGITDNDFSINSDLVVRSCPKLKNYHCPSPFFEYDSITSRLNFLLLYYPMDNEDNIPYHGVFSSSFKYVDSGFVEEADSNWYYPSLCTLNDTFLVSSTNIGGYSINKTILNRYEEESDGSPNLYLEQELSINCKKFNDLCEGCDTFPISEYFLSCKLQQDTSLIIPTYINASGNSPGPCGACAFDYYRFYSLRRTISKKILSCSFNLDDGTTDYEYSDSAGRLHTGNFYLIQNPNERENVKGDLNWEDNSTLLIKIHEFGEHDKSKMPFREFRFKFISSNGSSYVTLTIGKDLTREGSQLH